ncbi:HBL340Cp [Eremothecium sinecaudum]|uniref:Ubiquitin carboxyl-terminal hydrolase n=1 Tax=Eremothecium sinecaudum TaxID=45286 RepID=A0A109UWR1_9SACH|nr:HBL340Cp [Eremothecium sinecaudum]AMD18562.1 HBL340Cp [Eremothecium sinecaudum]
MVCQHIEQVMQNPKVGDAVVRECITVRYLIKNCDAKNRYLRAMRCSECLQINCGNSFLCLQCGFVGCWNGQHFLEHSKKVGHIFGVNAVNELLFCFRCFNYIGDNELVWMDIVPKYWDEVLSRSSVPGIDRRDGLHGLVNMGSTCFMSSVVQTLVHIPPVLRELLGQTHQRYCDVRDGMGCISCAIDEVVSSLYGYLHSKDKPALTPPTSEEETSGILNPVQCSQQGFINLLTCSWKINKSLAGYSQQDAHEFWQFLLNQLHADYVRLHGSPTKPTPCGCILHQMFQGRLESSIVCAECNDDSNTTVDPIMDLSLGIHSKSTLIECLDSFHRREPLTDYTYRCKSCQSTRSPTRQLTMAKLPPVLMLQLKRFEHLMNGTSVKLNEYISFPQHLNMKDYCKPIDDQNPVPNMTYRLTAIISHHGSVDQGHYTTICRINGDRWVRFNDSMVTLISEEDMLKEQAYLLCYVVA